MPRAKKAASAPDTTPQTTAPAPDGEAAADVEVDAEAAPEVEEEEEEEEEAAVVVEDDIEAEEEEDEEEKPVARPAARPAPGRPPGAKDEPDPPFYVGERIRLTDNLRPRTGVPIGDYPVGAEGRVETVLSLTCIVTFDQAPNHREVVAFTGVESIDPECIARRAERDRAKAAAEKEAEKERKAAEKG